MNLCMQASPSEVALRDAGSVFEDVHGMLVVYNCFFTNK